SGATLVNIQATGTITPRVPPSISIASAAVIANAAAPTTLSFVVTLSAPFDQPVSVAYATADDTARADVDYVAKSGIVNFAPGQPLQQTIMVQVNAAPQYDVTKTFLVNLSAPTGGATIAAGQATGTIVNPNTLPRITIDGAAVIASSTATTTA